MTIGGAAGGGRVAPRTVNVNYSLPLAFDEGDLGTLRRAAEDAAQGLKALTGRTLLFPADAVARRGAGGGGYTCRRCSACTSTSAAGAWRFWSTTPSRATGSRPRGLPPHTVFSRRSSSAGASTRSRCSARPRVTAAVVRDARGELVHAPRQHRAPGAPRQACSTRPTSSPSSVRPPPSAARNTSVHRRVRRAHPLAGCARARPLDVGRGRPSRNRLFTSPARPTASAGSSARSGPA